MQTLFGPHEEFSSVQAEDVAVSIRDNTYIAAALDRRHELLDILETSRGAQLELAAPGRGRGLGGPSRLSPGFRLGGPPLATHDSTEFLLTRSPRPLPLVRKGNRFLSRHMARVPLRTPMISAASCSVIQSVIACSIYQLPIDRSRLLKCGPLSINKTASERISLFR